MYGISFRFGVFVLAAGVALVLGGCVFGGGDDTTVTSTPAPEGGASGSATAGPTGVATPEIAAELPPGLEVSASGTWESRELRAGDEVPDVLGAFVFDTEAGVGTLWSLASGAVEDPNSVFVGTSSGGEYVVAVTHIVQTSSGQSFGWGPRAGLVLIDDGGLALFQAQGCQFWVADLSGREPSGRATFELPGERNCNVAARFAPDGSELLASIQGNNVDGGAELFAVDLSTGEVALVSRLDVTYVWFAERVTTNAALLTGALPGVAWVGSYTWGSGEPSAVSIPSGAAPRGPEKKPLEPSMVTISPDGRWVAWAEVGDLGAVSGAGGLAEWPVTVIANIEEGVAVVRAERVTLTNGVVSFDWLADSSALVVQSEDGFGLLGTDGTFTELPFPVAEHFDPWPIPAPDRTDWFAYDGQVVDAGGALVGEVPAADVWGRGEPDGPPGWWSASRYGWGSDSGRLTFVRTEVPGSDFGRGGVAVLGLPARILTGAAATGPGPIELQVASDGDRLNVRAAPGLDAEVLGQFEHGAAVTVGRDASADVCGDLGCSILADPDLEYGEGWWIYVGGEDGAGEDLEGWVSAEFVDWAE